MKQIRKTTAKTRIGILNWMHKLQGNVHHIVPDNATAIYIHKFTGRLHGYDASTGYVIVHNPKHRYFAA